MKSYLVFYIFYFTYLCSIYLMLKDLIPLYKINYFIFIQKKFLMRMAFVYTLHNHGAVYIIY